MNSFPSLNDVTIEFKKVFDIEKYKMVARVGLEKYNAMGGDRDFAQYAWKEWGEQGVFFVLAKQYYYCKLGNNYEASGGDAGLRTYLNINYKDQCIEKVLPTVSLATPFGLSTPTFESKLQLPTTTCSNGIFGSTPTPSNWNSNTLTLSSQSLGNSNINTSSTNLFGSTSTGGIFGPTPPCFNGNQEDAIMNRAKTEWMTAKAVHKPSLNQFERMFSALKRYAELWLKQDRAGVICESTFFETALEQKIRQRLKDEGAGKGTLGAAVAGAVVGGPIGLAIGLGYGLLCSKAKDKLEKDGTTEYKQLMARYKDWASSEGIVRSVWS